ncbi:MAG: dolichyl-phosphate beta-glucosyltransferase [Sclerophora amabilis]|nr:MAG: dolichyl-phosphate beta-glucosyltransferase [Sclerophora amabilis]
MSSVDLVSRVSKELLGVIQNAPLSLVLLFLVTTILGAVSLFYFALFIAAPIPRCPLPSEKCFRTISPDGKTSSLQSLPCWQEKYKASKQAAEHKGDSTETVTIEEADLFMSVVVPAFNEEERLEEMLQEAVDYLTEASSDTTGNVESSVVGNKTSSNGSALQASRIAREKGWEVLVVSDGSTDRTIETALNFARTYQPALANGTASKHISNKSRSDTRIPVGAIRVISLEHNRGKGGATIHGMRHVRGQYAVFADADGASKFADLGKLVTECQRIEDDNGRGVAVGSRAHLVGSEAVVQRSFLRNLLMHSFHVFLRLLTPPATAAIKDTQCGFKLFSRSSLPYIIPYMHSEGWIFDVEMLMLAESAGIPVAEVAVGWKEVKGSKLNVLRDSLGMAWGLAILRGAWGFGVYRR